MATLAQADQVIGLQDGMIAESGTRQELFARRGVYHRLVASQTDELFTGEEPFGDQTRLGLVER